MTGDVGAGDSIAGPGSRLPIDKTSYKPMNNVSFLGGGVTRKLATSPAVRKA